MDKLQELIEAARDAQDVLFAVGEIKAARNLELAISEALRQPKRRDPRSQDPDRNCDWCSAPAGIEVGCCDSCGGSK
jgi:CRISPR/Cas system-associated protein Cas10 (large subunit of type III CRISPR-Cas system)